jgi:hypothetical protein
MANMYDEMYDDFYATVCPRCNENNVDEYEEKCGHCMITDFESLFDLEPEDLVDF